MTIEAMLTSKGQTTIPKPIRDGLGMKPGDRLRFTLMRDGTVLMRLKSRQISNLAGRLHKRRRKLQPVEQLSR
jgi:antitoxin PrlF